jgi:ABC-type transport system involved in cytochrome bd biosynthesis fused ATPase/permease subunit
LFDKNNNELWRILKQEKFLHELFNKCANGLSTMLNEKRVELSLGQQKIISLYRVILQNPSVVILDEYFSNLDTHARDFSIKLIEKYFIGKTIINITHEKSEIEKMEQIIELGKS